MLYIYIYDLHWAALHKLAPPQAATNTFAARDKVPGAISAELIQQKWKFDQPPILRSNCMIPKACPQLLRLFFFVGVEAQPTVAIEYSLRMWTAIQMQWRYYAESVTTHCTTFYTNFCLHYILEASRVYLQTTVEVESLDAPPLSCWNFTIFL